MNGCAANVSLTEKPRKPLVGAAGFEPATWSTQNSRATRLRYAPPRSRARSAKAEGGFCVRPRSNTRFCRKPENRVATRYTLQRGSASRSMLCEHRGADTVAGCDPQLVGRASEH